MVDDVSLYSRLYQKTCVVQTYKIPISPERQRPLLQQIYMRFCALIVFFQRKSLSFQGKQSKRAQSRWPTTSASPVRPRFSTLILEQRCVSPFPYRLSKGSFKFQEELSEGVIS